MKKEIVNFIKTIKIIPNMRVQVRKHLSNGKHEMTKNLMKSVMVSMPTNFCLAESHNGQARTPVSTIAKNA